MQGRTNYMMCPYCSTLTLRSLSTGHSCRNKPATCLRFDPKEVALEHNGWRTQAQKITSHELFAHIKARCDNTILKSCCRRAAISAAGYCGTLVVRPKVQHQQFEPKNMRLYNLEEHNMLYNGKLQWTGHYDMDHINPLTAAEIIEVSEQDMEMISKGVQCDLGGPQKDLQEG